MKRIKLELARDPEFPHGSSEHGYELAAPLDEVGHIAHDEWRQKRECCPVIRFWSGEEKQIGRLVHRGGGWAFDYDPKSTGDDEPGFKFDRRHRFVPGEYVSIRERDGDMCTFRIARCATWIRSKPTVCQCCDNIVKPHDLTRRALVGFSLGRRHVSSCPG